MSEIVADTVERKQRYSFDRQATAIALRECGVDVDLEDWDDQADESILEGIAILADGYGFEMEKNSERKK